MKRIALVVSARSACNKLIAVILVLFSLVVLSCSRKPPTPVTDPESASSLQRPESVELPKPDTVTKSATNVDAVKPLLAKAINGDAAAQLDLGEMYYQGGEVPKDYAEALTWFRKAAAQGLPEAQSNIGLMYCQGEGVPQDYAEAMNWFQRAASHGYAVAQLNIGGLYHDGQGVPQDYAEAMKWFRKAAEQDLSQAQFNLALMCSRGEGTPMDFVQGYMWGSLAAERDNPSATFLVSSLENALPASQIAQGRVLAAQWKTKKGK